MSSKRAAVTNRSGRSSPKRSRGRQPPTREEEKTLPGCLPIDEGQLRVTTAALFVAAIVLLNVLLGWALLAAGIYADNAGQFTSVLRFIELGLSLLGGGLLLAFWLPSAAISLREGVPDARFLRVVIVGLLVAYTGATVSFAGDESATGMVTWSDSPAILLFLIAFWEWVRAHSAYMLDSRVEGLVGALEGSVLVREGGSTDIRLVPAERVPVGTVFVMEKGGRVLLDGTVLEGTGIIAERGYGVESTLRVVQEGDSVWAGSTLRSGRLIARSDALVAESRSAEALLAAGERWRGLQLPGDAFTRLGFTLLFAAVGTSLLWRQYDASLQTLLMVAMSTLLIGTGWDLFMARPRLFRLALAELFSRGVLAGRGADLHELAALRGVAMSLPERSAQQEVPLILKEFQSIDDRFDLRGLQSIALGLASRGEGEIPAVYRRQWAGRAVEELRAVRVSNFHSYRDRGMCGEVEGVDVTFGDEDFLLQRGVELTPTDIGPVAANERLWLLAIESTVVARVRFENVEIAELKELRAGIRAIQLQPLIVAADRGSREELAAAGFLPEELGEGSVAEIVTKRFPGLRPVMTLASPKHEKEIRLASDMTAENFDELVHDFSSSDIIIFPPAQPDSVGEAILVARAVSWRDRFLTWSSGVVSVLLLVGVILGVITASVVVSTGLAMLLVLCVVALAPFPSVRAFGHAI